MNKLWLPLLAVVLAGCSTDKTLETLIPRNALAVVLVEHPSFAAQALGSSGGVPWKALDLGKPLAAAVVPANPPGFLVAVPLADQPGAWAEVEGWARAQGGLSATRAGTYALLSTGLPAGTLDPDRRFDLSRVRAGGDAVAVYIDVHNVATEAALPEVLRPALAGLPWAQKNLAGIRLGFEPKDGGLELRAATDWAVGAEAAQPFRGWTVPSDPDQWSALLPATDGGGFVASLPGSAWEKAALAAGDPQLSQWWSALAPLLGPRIAVAVQFGGQNQLSWAAAVETRDAQGVRQALRTLVAGGLLQKKFADWAMDADTPLIYQDKKEGGAVRATVHWGEQQFLVGYGSDRVTLAGGPGSAEALTRWQTTPVPAAWAGKAPSHATALLAGSAAGLGAKGAFSVLDDGNLELRVWVDAAALKTWEERLPQALPGWLSGAADSQTAP